ncbi:pro-neuregulin-3, membrane-bound isoform-like isoform X6 [Dermacentor silvarum]|uniref:pro-neuregulin-3, membrane-bound isoform-like isoform X6 n=1 Tax=Dermacentor silvarum TaxID=543639 RepID=UPI00210125D7|nr:pro-neuregulin-3, membrane-bound isoform-like isoform X6 [Dermacentor silvarum]
MALNVTDTAHRHRVFGACGCGVRLFPHSAPQSGWSLPIRTACTPTSGTDCVLRGGVPRVPSIRRRTCLRGRRAGSSSSSSSSSPSPASSCGAGGPWWPKGLLQVDSRRLATCPPGWLLFIVLAAALLRIADGCSSRSTPKPRPPQSTVRPNITFQTYTCPETYAKWYCLNGATCFSIKIGESILYNCECADGYMGQRCEFKDLDGTYLPTRQRVLIETASIAGGVTVAVILVFIVCVTVYLYYR